MIPGAIDLGPQRDGLYRVRTPYLCAGFELKAGRVVRCAPILLGRLAYWRSIATWIAPLEGKT